MFISPAYAQAAEAAGGASALQAFMPMILIAAVFYFLLIRPQQKKMKEHKAMLDAVRRGDKVVTGGGIIGTVSKVNDDELVVEIADDVKIRVMRGTLSSVMSKSEPVKADADDKGGDDASSGSKLKGLLGGKKD